MIDFSLILAVSLSISSQADCGVEPVKERRERAVCVAEDPIEGVVVDIESKVSPLRSRADRNENSSVDVGACTGEVVPMLTLSVSVDGVLEKFYLDAEEVLGLSPTFRYVNGETIVIYGANFTSFEEFRALLVGKTVRFHGLGGAKGRLAKNSPIWFFSDDFELSLTGEDSFREMSSFNKEEIRRVCRIRGFQRRSINKKARTKAGAICTDTGMRSHSLECVSSQDCGGARCENGQCTTIQEADLTSEDVQPNE